VCVRSGQRIQRAHCPNSGLAVGPILRPAVRERFGKPGPFSRRKEGVAVVERGAHASRHLTRMQSPGLQGTTHRHEGTRRYNAGQVNLGMKEGSHNPYAKQPPW